ncbi:MAG: NOL1/NOP2/sun family putative RNA methylase [Candidatus Aminicenantes bacterium]|nr:NOL1/NOP2/sun family putative RNA methylase [Candidatus Aminicenantes bacterium]
MVEIPSDFLQRYSEILGEALLQDLVKYIFKPLRRSLRVNTLKAEPQEIKILLEEKGYRLEPVPWAKEGFWVYGEGDGKSTGKELYHLMGLYYIQDASSMVPPLVLQPQPGETVLDMAAAPGGKATHIAALMQNEGVLVANEPLLYRAKVLVGNLERMGVRNSALTILKGNSFGWRFSNFFDRILLDAPCSAEGSTRKEEGFFDKLWNLSYIRRARNVQKALIVSAIHSLKPGGILVYSTCTMTPEENEEILAHALDRFGEKIEVIDVKLKGLKTMPGIPAFEDKVYPEKVRKIARIWPFLNDTEAFTVFALIKKEETFPAAVKRGKKPEGKLHGKLVDSGLKKDLLEFLKPYGDFEFLKRERLVLSGDHIWYQPVKFLPLFERTSLNRAGVKIARVYNNGTFRPTHAFLLAFSEYFTGLKRVLDEEEAFDFATGKNLNDLSEYPREFIPLFFRSYPLGWGKKNERVLLNKLPTPLVLR